MKYVVGLFLAGTLFGQNGAPNVVNARFETRALAGDLSSVIKSPTAAWFGYAIRTARGDHQSCCWNSNGNGCWLEGNGSGAVTITRPAQPIPLEGTDTIALLFRSEQNAVEKIRIVSLECPLDAGGLPFTWITAVPAARSVEFVQRLVDSAASTKISNEAILALSMHADTGALDALIQLAKSNPSSHIREQALFWLAQKAGARAVATIENAIVNDPDTNVKKRAVFALSQLPKDEGVPKLIEIARTQRNPEVRKQAFFWLGQSNDPRALAFFEEILAK